MRPLPFYSQKALIAKGRSIQQGMEVVSFDLFDTLLVRRTHDPDLVKAAGGAVYQSDGP